MNSLRNRLFVILVVATGAIWLAAICWIYVGTKLEIESVLDARLQEAARMAASLIPDDVTAPQSKPQTAPLMTKIPGTERQISCQIWSLDGRLVARSNGAPEEQLSDVPEGFSERLISGEIWRVYTMQDTAKDVRVLVGDRLGVRDHLVTEIIKGLLAPTLLIVPLLGFLIWASLQQGLAPLRNIARELKRRNADDMSPMSTGGVPTEIQPVVAALNGLFTKVEAARQHEREITAFAAHELRTPLAGLRMQAQISIAATDKAVRETALRQILVSVDRTTRLVRQLLAISKLDTTAHGLTQEANVNLGEVIDETIEALPFADKKINVVIDPSLRYTSLKTNRELLLLTFRNLHENAVGHMPPGGSVRWSAAATSDRLVVSVEDDGPGIPEDEINLVTNRFFRGRHKSAFGSGLGLAIVDLALKSNGAELAFKNRNPGHGLRVEISWRIKSENGALQTIANANSPSLGKGVPFGGSSIVENRLLSKLS